MKPTPSFRTPPTSATQRGMSLIEVLISVLILGIGMLGIAAMQAAALRNGTTSMQQSQAVIEANAMMDAMRANPTTVYSLAMAASPCTPPANSGTVDSSDKHWWISNLQSTISPSACGSISCNASICTVTVKWTDNLSASAGQSPPVVVVSRL